IGPRPRQRCAACRRRGQSRCGSSGGGASYAALVHAPAAQLPKRIVARLFHAKSAMARKNPTLKSVADRLLPKALVWRRELEELRTAQHRREDALNDEIVALRTELETAREDAARRDAEFERRFA